MAANPPLCQDPYYGHTFPLPYHGEQICLSRGCIDIKLEGGALRTRGNNNMRLCFVADKPDTSSGLHAFELPLAFITDEDFKQPIFNANNLSGRCFMVDGGPAGGEAVQWTLYFKDGGVGTFIPFFFRSCAYVRSIASRMQQQQQYQQPAGVGYPPPATAAPEAGAAPPQQLLQTALVDPSDPTKVYLTQPLDSSQQRDDAPKFPAPLV
ncbi:hypothetical protein CHLNCDRAFT_134845 [Chlorella variabilis]|uniref:GRAM domain-containing protein n=1 Tax=Chlorella variabilis TaxID=554065 RepID=E1ZGX7_CHLVA|nr:hypothetical protein CHLNCDRAFT_134845 [Chlorella variabilis]EFN55018.1 hypothetical protein CHLNCDRAFT_134845 [Chlorella variabilis]|eukprot:XP_005847120.1 hypothetical protein CHLNCDRAFT_134845 [Chlorella variabilis]